MISTAPLPSQQPSAEEELIGLFDRRGLRVPLTVIVSAMFIAWLAFERAPLALSAGWVAAVSLVLLARHLIVSACARRTDWPIRHRLNALAAISALGGLTQGASVLLWPYLNEAQHSVLSVYVLGLCAGAVAAEFGQPRIFPAYMVPMLVQLGITWTRDLSSRDPAGWTGSAGVLLLMILIYAGMLVTLARDTWQLFRESFDVRQRLQGALEVAEAANRAKTRFLASASHDLRQPMHTLSLFGAALGMRQLDERSHAIVGQMNQALQALSSQLDSLLDVSKLDAGVVNIQRADFALDLLFERLHSEFAPMAARKGLVLRVAVPPGARAHTDAMLLERVLRNLLDNAIKYTDLGEVDLRAKGSEGGWVIEISDSGPGIWEHEHERVFEEFYQLGNPERDRRQGLGLGLSIVRRLVDLLQLQLRMRSAPGQGTAFTLNVPTALTAAEPHTLPPAALPSLAGIQVLVIDDEEAVREGMQTLLDGLGCLVRAAGGTAEALALAQARAPDVVLADFRLRGTDDGVHAVRRLREQRPGLAALLISGDTAPERLREARAAGLQLLHKPVAVDALVRAIDQVLRRETR